jgi:tRNA (cmo5U34)-methyltransferase
MVERCKENLAGNNNPIPTEVVCDDIRNVEINHASFSVLNFTLQFISQDKRLELLKTICDGTLPGGALVLSEKITFEQKHEKELLTNLHHDFKRANGYSDLEISQKRTALENVLIPDTFSQHRERLMEAGFSQVYQWFQCFNFISLLAIK